MFDEFAKESNYGCQIIVVLFLSEVLQEKGVGSIMRILFLTLVSSVIY